MKELQSTEMLTIPPELQYFATDVTQEPTAPDSLACSLQTPHRDHSR